MESKESDETMSFGLSQNFWLEPKWSQRSQTKRTMEFGLIALLYFVLYIKSGAITSVLKITVVYDSMARIIFIVI